MLRQNRREGRGETERERVEANNTLTDGYLIAA